MLLPSPVATEREPDHSPNNSLANQPFSDNFDEALATAKERYFTRDCSFRRALKAIGRITHVTDDLIRLVVAEAILLAAKAKSRWHVHVGDS